MAKKNNTTGTGNGQAGGNSKVPIKSTVSMNDRAKTIFDSHPKVEELYFTTDGQAFFEPQHARMHGESLENHEFVTINRKDE